MTRHVRLLSHVTMSLHRAFIELHRTSPLSCASFLRRCKLSTPWVKRSSVSKLVSKRSAAALVSSMKPYWHGFLAGLLLGAILGGGIVGCLGVLFMAKAMVCALALVGAASLLGSPTDSLRAVFLQRGGLEAAEEEDWKFQDIEIEPREDWSDWDIEARDRAEPLEHRDRAAGGLGLEPRDRAAGGLEARSTQEAAAAAQEAVAAEEVDSPSPSPLQGASRTPSPSPLQWPARGRQRQLNVAWKNSEGAKSMAIFEPERPVLCPVCNARCT